MTVKELIEELQRFPSDMRVIRNGYEGGYSDVRSISELDIVLDVNIGCRYLGNHDEADQEKDETAVLIR